MRKIFTFLMTSLDGYHETGAGELFWHNVDTEFLEFAAAQLDEADTLLFGRKTYQHMAAFWPAEAGLTGVPQVAVRMNSFHKIVVSRTLTDAAWTPVTVIRDDVPARLAKIKEQSGKDIALIGSSELAASLLGTGVIDEVRIMVNPVVLGDGHPVLAGAERMELELLRIRQFASGNVLLTYGPRAGGPGQRALG
jgi:dihydrofolate reductase